MSYEETLNAFFNFTNSLPDTIRDSLMQRAILTINPSEIDRLRKEPDATKEVFRNSIETNGSMLIDGVIIACGYFDHLSETAATKTDIERSKYTLSQMEAKEPVSAALKGVFARQELSQRHMEKFRKDWIAIRENELSPGSLSLAHSHESSLRSQIAMQEMLDNRNPDD